MEIIKTKYLKLTFKYNFLSKILKCSSRTKIKSLKNNKVLERESNYFVINENGMRPLLFIHSGMYSKNPLNYQIKFLKKLATLTNYKIYIPFYTSPNPSSILTFINSFSSPSILCQGLGGGITFSLYNKLNNIQKIVCISPWMQLSSPFLDAKVREDFKVLNAPYLTELDDNVESLIINGEHELLRGYISIFCKNNISKNIKWLEYENMSEGFVFYPSLEAVEPTRIIADFLQN
ncbi:MAG TPA: hypothetical protein IAA62_02460 [Candidatus Caccopulliclostridium gallistercoris]|uniref:Alpha/beta hydrolase n=1 Tax=Candidatus Caccopulliclostridium gallistercoris TaxID=2840719 RepID=A0A9D1NEV3_9FIRM|nr:hypothetical protein [Candidatus Caccopulliclostridium gallistercoris]